MSDVKRTPVKWEINPGDPYEIIDDNGDVVAWVNNEPAENEPLMAMARARAAFIVRACNAHDALVKLAEDIRDWLANAPIDYSNGNVDPSGCFDEGDVLGWRYHEELKVQCAAAIALATEKANDEAR